MVAGLDDLDGADQRPAPAAAGVGHRARAPKARPLDLERRAGRGDDGDLEPARDVEVVAVAALRAVALLVAQPHAPGRQRHRELARNRERPVVVGAPAGLEHAVDDVGVDHQERDYPHHNQRHHKHHGA